HATHNASNTGGMEAALADMFLQAGQYDSCFYYLKAQLASRDLYDQLTLEWIGPLLADAYLMTGRLDSALYYYDRIIDTFKSMATTEGVSEALRRSYYGKAKILVTKNDYKDALAYEKKSYAFAQWRGIRLSVLNNYDLLSELFHHLGKNDSAYYYSRKYIGLKDSVLTRQFYFRLDNYKKESEEQKKISQINLLNKDNELKEQKLKQQTIIRNSLIAGILLLFLLGVFVFHNLLLKRKNEKLQLKNELEKQQLENEKKHAELKQQAIELEMQALRAQMNPHFIFNCLSSINRFIFKNETRAASDYLTRFSRLIRMVLIHSQKRLIPLDDELEMLRLYLDMERLRFRNAFDYTLATTNAVESTSIFIPPLLLQPFCENAIWHGLMHKEGQGHLNISINEENKILHCVITDDGVGREKADEYKSKSAEKEKSLGLQITAKRLALLNGENSSGTFYKIEDLLDENGNTAGTKVNLKISYKESLEEIV
ncbi:MAG: histidine kinase, partial [Chitinophagales bacterium]